MFVLWGAICRPSCAPKRQTAYLFRYWILELLKWKEQEKRVHTMMARTQDDFKTQTGIEPSLTDSEAKEYLLEVLEEIKNKRK